MKTSTTLLLYLSLAIIGGAGVFYYQSTIPDHEFIKNDVAKRLLTIDGLNADVSELALRSRYNLDSNYDRLTRSSTLLDQAMSSFENAYFTEESISDTLLKRNFQSLMNEVEIKLDLIENFKSHNSVLRNSEKYAPAAGQNLIAIAKENNLKAPEILFSDIVKELLEFSLLGSSVSVQRLKTALPQLQQIESQMPDYAYTALLEFNNHVNTVINEKELTDQYLSKALNSTTDSKISELNENWNSWFLASGKQDQTLKQITIGYIVFLLLGLVFVTWRLKALYNNLDYEVAVQTEEIRKAFDELKDSESKLVQSEKMASLGQMVAGVAHEINTPLGYITSNVDTIRLNMGELDGILQSVEMISTEFKQSPPNSKKIGMIVKRMVQVYRNMRQRETLSEIEELLQDSSYGLSEIAKLVSSLKDFSRLDRSNLVQSHVHDGLNNTLKICGNLLSDKQVIKNYGQDIPTIECMPAQLNQVFLNIITNAAQATGPEGKILITTRTSKGGVEIIFEDNGVGMNEETQKQIFDPFFTTKEVGKGTGLGMSISYKIIKSHGGEISVRSEPNKGTQVIVNLPLAQTQGAELSVIK
jgi:signal transduction histidine kinase